LYLLFANSISLLVALHVVGEGGGGGVAPVANTALVRFAVVVGFQMDFQMVAPIKRGETNV
jgi:hypothetical protein